MKVIKPFFLGLFGGLALSLVLLVGLYFSPLRETAYFNADPELSDVRGKLSQYRDWLSQADLYIEDNQVKGSDTSDSLQTAQTLAWREYKKWRTHMGDLARAHAKPTVDGFWTWTYSLRYWELPITAFLALLPALLLAWRARSRFSAGRMTLRPVGGRAKTKAKNQAMASFEDAIKKVARISDNERKADTERIADKERSTEKEDVAAERQLDVEYPEPVVTYREEPPTAPIPTSEFMDGPDPVEAEPDTKPIPIISDTGLETNFLQTGPVWGEPIQAAGLSMEDEDGESDDGARGVMPPTTEVERIERRKEEVVKLARKGLTSSEISRRMRISQDQVEFIIRLRREKG